MVSESPTFIALNGLAGGQASMPGTQDRQFGGIRKASRSPYRGIDGKQTRFHGKQFIDAMHPLR